MGGGGGRTGKSIVWWLQPFPVCVPAVTSLLPVVPRKSASHSSSDRLCVHVSEAPQGLAVVHTCVFVSPIFSGAKNVQRINTEQRLMQPDIILQSKRSLRGHSLYRLLELFSPRSGSQRGTRNEHPPPPLRANRFSGMVEWKS